MRFTGCGSNWRARRLCNQLGQLLVGCRFTSAFRFGNGDGGDGGGGVAECHGEDALREEFAESGSGLAQGRAEGLAGKEWHYIRP